MHGVMYRCIKVETCFPGTSTYHVSMHEVMYRCIKVENCIPGASTCYESMHGMDVSTHTEAESFL